jgi:hypothetical protein
LIREAVEYADGVVGEITIRGAVMSDKADKWNRAYFGKMDELAHTAGLTPWIKKKGTVND